MFTLENKMSNKVSHTSKAPTCLNHGCNSKCAYSNTRKNGEKRYRPVCWHCHRASYGKHPHKSGVTPFRTGICSNQDGRLGFLCPVDYDKAPWAIGKTETDHKDGDPLNNVPSNAQELCKICHSEKGRINGDFRRRH